MLIFIRVLIFCSEKRQIAPPVVVRKKGRENQYFLPISPTVAVRGYLRLFLRAIFSKENVIISRSHCHRSEMYVNRRAKSHKKVELQRYPKYFFRQTLLCARFFNQKVLNFWQPKKLSFFKNPGKKHFWGACWARSASEKLRRIFCSERRDSESSTDIDRQN